MVTILNIYCSSLINKHMNYKKYYDLKYKYYNHFHDFNIY